MTEKDLNTNNIVGVILLSLNTTAFQWPGHVREHILEKMRVCRKAKSCSVEITCITSLGRTHMTLRLNKTLLMV